MEKDLAERSKVPGRVVDGDLVLEGHTVRLEPLGPRHEAGLVAASSEDPSLYRFASVPRGEEEVAAFVEEAVAGVRGGDVVAFATILRRDGRVVGSTRFLHLEWWPWPRGHELGARTAPDVAEIGYTWLAASAVRTAVNTEAKFLMLSHAFDVWEMQRVRLRTDRRNERSWAAIERIGARFDGVLRADRIGADQTVRDSAYFSILKAEWPACRSRLLDLLDRGSSRQGSS